MCPNKPHAKVEPPQYTFLPLCPLNLVEIPPPQIRLRVSKNEPKIPEAITKQPGTESHSVHKPRMTQKARQTKNRQQKCKQKTQKKTVFFQQITQNKAEKSGNEICEANLLLP